LSFDAHLLVQPLFPPTHVAQRSKAVLDLASAGDFIENRAVVDVGVGLFGDGASHGVASFDIIFENWVVGHRSKIAGEVGRR
jgi:hypothetical protein